MTFESSSSVKHFLCWPLLYYIKIRLLFDLDSWITAGANADLLL